MYEYLNLQFRTVPMFGAWSHIDERDLETLKGYQDNDWEVYQTVNLRGSMGFSSHVLFMLRRPREARD